MLFNSIKFLIFLPIVLAIYHVMPKRLKPFWLLLASCFFYMCWNAKYIVLIFISIILTYIAGLCIEKIKNKYSDEKKKKRKMKLCLAICLLLNLSILFFFKYYDFALSSLTKVFNTFNIQLNAPKFDFMLPIGISFYTFQALGYIIDVYRNNVKAERNFIKYALFVSFFPQLVAGPIERSKNLLSQLDKREKLNYKNLREGFFIMVWGFFLKLVIADRISIFVTKIFDNYNEFSGLYLIIAVVLFGFQIYCDFNGYSTIAKGSAKMLNIELMDNFNAPYLSRSVGEFWRRWHISLSTWFKDYLYIPLGGNRKGKFRKYLNILIVFIVSGLWHGANWTFVIWGALNGVFQIIGDIFKNIRKRVNNFLRIKEDGIFHKIIQIIITFILINFTWIFFRANSFTDAINIIRGIFTNLNPAMLLNSSIFNLGLSEASFRILMIGLIVLVVADILKYKKINILAKILNLNYVLRCLILLVTIGFILVFGIYGSAYDATQFIYFQF